VKKKSSIIFSILTFSLVIVSCLNNRNENEYALKPHIPSGESDYYQGDSIAGHFHVSNAFREFKWPEHPLGKIEMKTNNMGFRDDDETKIEKSPGLNRVIITGDSHTDGVLYNSESVSAQLEKLLISKYPEKDFEVLNAGNGYYGPQNYFGVFKKFLYLKPDVFIVIVYTGNDYVDAIRIESENSRLSVPERPKDYFDKLWEIDGLYSGFTGQYLNQVKFFKTYPLYADTALQIMTENLQGINKLCSKNDVEFLVMLMPAKLDTEPETDISRIVEVLKIMDFNEKDKQNNQILTTTLAMWLSENNIPFIDLFEPFRNSSDELFWKADYHINHLGHELMVEEIIESELIHIN